MDWDTLFMNMAYLVASKSKDASTHVGAVIVGPDNEVRSVGYNSFPRGIDDDIPARQERPEKYYWFTHAEANGIHNAARVGIPIKGCKLYTNGVPCDRCAGTIINAGIVEVITDFSWAEGEDRAEWDDPHRVASEMLKEAGVKVRTWKGNLVTIERFKRGKSF